MPFRPPLALSAAPARLPHTLPAHSASPHRMVHTTDIVELELNSKKFKLSVKKREALEAAEPQVIHMPAASAAYAAPAPVAMPAPAAPAAAPAPAAPAAPAPAPAAAAPAPAAAAPADGLEVVSPMAGTMYRSPAPGEPVFVKEGDRVTKGQVVCIIEGELMGVEGCWRAMSPPPALPITRMRC
jgi:acetyl-CoA carboxylase biotin carboxyl carrier protein